MNKEDFIKALDIREDEDGNAYIAGYVGGDVRGYVNGDVGGDVRGSVFGYVGGGVRGSVLGTKREDKDQ